jgi:hypothetical protein
MKINTLASKDELRPALEGVFKNGKYLYATNGYIAIRINCENEFEKIPDGKIIRPDIYVELLNGYILECDNESITLVDRIITRPYIDEKFPDIEGIFNTGQTELIDSVGFSLNLLLKLKTALTKCGFSGEVRMKFYGKNKGIVVTPINSSCYFTCILMPLMNHDN